MTQLGFRKPRRPQFLVPRQAPPPGTYEVDRDHPLAQGLTALYMPVSGQVVNLLGTSGPLNSVSSTNAIIQLGPRGLEATSTAPATGWYGTGPANIVGASTGTVFCLSRALAGGYSSSDVYDNPPLFGFVPNTSNSSPYVGMGINWTNANPPLARLTFNNGGYNDVTSTTPAPTSPDISFWCGSVNLNGTCALYRNGVVIASGTGPGGTISIGAAAVAIGIVYGSSGVDDCQAGVIIAGFYSIALSPALNAWLASDPFAMLRRRVKKLYSLPGLGIVPKSLLMGAAG